MRKAKSTANRVRLENVLGKLFIWIIIWTDLKLTLELSRNIPQYIDDHRHPLAIPSNASTCSAILYLQLHWDLKTYNISCSLDKVAKYEVRCLFCTFSVFFLFENISEPNVLACVFANLLVVSKIYFCFTRVQIIYL